MSRNLIFNHLRVLAAASGLALAACSDSSTAPSPNQPRRASVEIVGVPTSLYESDSFTLRAVVRDSLGQVQPDAPVAWSVNDPRLAEVYGDNFMALRGGAVTLEANAAGVRASLTVNINALTVKEVTVTSSSLSSLSVGDVVPLGVRVLGEGGRQVNGRAVTLSSADPSIAFVDAAGRVRGVRAGSTSIRATVGGVVGTAAVTVRDVNAVLQLSKLDGSRLPKLVDADSVSWDGEREYHEVYVETGTFTLTGGAQPRYEIIVRYAEYDVRIVNGVKSMLLRRTWREYDRGVVAYDARGDLQMTSEYISPLSHVAFPDVGGMQVRYRIPGTDEHMQLFYRREPE